MPDPYVNLAKSIKDHIVGHAQNALKSVATDLGTITATGLKLDNFKEEIQDYLVGAWTVDLNLPAFSISGTMFPDIGEQTHIRFEVEESEIKGAELSFAKALKPGDRVLAIPVNSGNDAVVICKVVNGGA